MTDPFEKKKHIIYSLIITFAVERHKYLTVDRSTFIGAKLTK